jgi:hypothetical protein
LEVRAQVVSATSQSIDGRASTNSRAVRENEEFLTTDFTEDTDLEVRVQVANATSQ